MALHISTDSFRIPPKDVPERSKLTFIVSETIRLGVSQELQKVYPKEKTISQIIENVTNNILDALDATLIENGFSWSKENPGGLFGSQVYDKVKMAFEKGPVLRSAPDAVPLDKHKCQIL